MLFNGVGEVLGFEVVGGPSLVEDFFVVVYAESLELVLLLDDGLSGLVVVGLHFLHVLAVVV